MRFGKEIIFQERLWKYSIEISTGDSTHMRMLQLKDYFLNST